MVGGQDELVFDGDSLVVDADGEVLARAPAVRRGAARRRPRPAGRDRAHRRRGQPCGGSGRLRHDDPPRPALERPAPPVRSRWRRRSPSASRTRPRCTARWSLGLRDYVGKNGFRSVAARAVRRDRLRAGRGHRLRRARRGERLRRLQPERLLDRGLAHRRRRAGPAHGPELPDGADRPDGRRRTRTPCDLDGLAEENLQARIRGGDLDGAVQPDGHLVLASGNKSELAVGYSTIYGDAVGGFAPIKDVPKTLGVGAGALAQRRRRARAARPRRSRRTRSPSRRPRSCVPASSTPTRCPTTSCSTTSSTTTSSRTAGPASCWPPASTRTWSSRCCSWSTARSTSAASTRPARRSRSKAFGRDRRLPITNRWREHAPRP